MTKQCPECLRVFMVNADGQIRKHWCHLIIGESKKIALATGGTISICLNANVMLFGDAERALFCTLVDALHEYERVSRPEVAAGPPGAAQEPK